MLEGREGTRDRGSLRRGTFSTTAPTSLWGQSLLGTAEEVLSATVTGFAFAAARLHVGSIWGLAVVHALGNFCNDISAGVPLWAYLVVDALIFAYG